MCQTCAYLTGFASRAVFVNSFRSLTVRVSIEESICSRRRNARFGRQFRESNGSPSSFADIYNYL